MDDSTTKRCSKCEETKSLDLFPRNRAKPDGHGGYCKACKSAYDIARRAADPTVQRAYAIGLRARNGDKMRAWARDYYVRNRDDMRAYAKDWLERHPEEKARYRQQSVEWHRANQARAYASSRANLKANIDRYRRYSREYAAKRRAADPDRFRAQQQEWRDKNRDKVRESSREYRRKNIDRMRHSWRLNRAKRRGAMAGVTVDYNLIWQRDGGICHICGEFVAPDDIHFDHVIPLSKGGPHTYDNIKVAHSACNMHKRNKLL